MKHLSLFFIVLNSLIKSGDILNSARVLLANLRGKSSVYVLKIFLLLRNRNSFNFSKKVKKLSSFQQKQEINKFMYMF